MAPILRPPMPSVAANIPTGFDRVKAVPIVPHNGAYQIFSTKGTLLGAADTLAAAEAFRDTIALEKLFT